MATIKAMVKIPVTSSITCGSRSRTTEKNGWGSLALYLAVCGAELGRSFGVVVSKGIPSICEYHEAIHHGMAAPAGSRDANELAAVVGENYQ